MPYHYTTNKDITTPQNTSQNYLVKNHHSQDSVAQRGRVFNSPLYYRFDAKYASENWSTQWLLF